MSLGCRLPLFGLLNTSNSNGFNWHSFSLNETMIRRGGSFALSSSQPAPFECPLCWEARLYRTKGGQISTLSTLFANFFGIKHFLSHKTSAKRAHYGGVARLRVDIKVVGLLLLLPLAKATYN